MKILLAPEADQELSDATGHYAEVGSPELAAAFLAEFRRTVALIEHSPLLGAPWHTRYRRILMRRFPYSLIYVVEPDRLRILALAHHRRRPAYWSGRS